MAIPNLLAAANCVAKTAVLAVTTSATAIVTNSAASGKSTRVNALWISNVDGVNSADITIDLFRSSVAYRLANTIAVPGDTTLDFLSKPLILEEGDTLRLTASANSDLEAVCSYEEFTI